MSDKVSTTTVNATGQSVMVIADTAAALATAVAAKKLDQKPTRPDISLKGDGNKFYKDF